MHRSPGRYALIVASLVMVLLAVGTVWAQKLPPTKAKKPAAAATAEPAAPQSAEQVDAYMGSLTDEQARKALSRTLKQQLAGKGQAGEVERGMDAGLGIALHAPGRRRGRPEGEAGGHGRDGRCRPGHPGRGLGTRDGGRRAAALRARPALAGRDPDSGVCRTGRLFPRRARPHRLHGDRSGARPAGAHRAGDLATRSCRSLGLLVFAAVSFALFVVFFDKGDPGYELVSVYLLLGYYVLILAVAARILFAPGAPALRLFPMPDDVAHRVHRWLMAVILGAAVVTGASLVLDEAGVGRSTFLLVYSLSGVYFVLALLAADLVPPQAGGRCAAACRRGCGRRRGARRAGARLALAGIRVRGRHGGVLDLGRADRRRRPGGPTHLEPVRDPGRHRDRHLGAAAHPAGLRRADRGGRPERGRGARDPPGRGGEGLQDLRAADPAPVPAGARGLHVFRDAGPLGGGPGGRADLHHARAQHRGHPAARVHRLGARQGAHRQPAAPGDAGRGRGRGGGRAPGARASAPC